MTTATRNGTFPHDARSAAEVYLNKGLAPLALPPRSKGEGLQEGWQRLRLTPDALDEHFPPLDDRNVGILNGAPSGNVLDVDLDCSEAVQAAPILLPPTGWVFGRASAPRSHWIFRADRPLDAAQEKYADLDGSVLVELRGSGGLTVYPPSTHKGTGEQIIWEKFTDPAEVALDELQRAIREVAAAALLARHWPAKGSRQDAFLALVGGLLRAGWSQDRTVRFVEALVASTRDDEPAKRAQTVAQTADKLEKKDRNVTGWPKLETLLGFGGKDVIWFARQWLGVAPPAWPARVKKARMPEPYRPFPVEALPAPVAEYVRQGALALGCDAAYLALPALAVVASAIGNTRAIKLKGGWCEPSVVWSAIVGDSGTLKSPAFLKAVAHLFRIQKQLLKEHEERMKEYEEELEEYQAAKKKAKEDGTDPGEPPEEPVPPRIVCSDTTIEKLAELLQDNPRGLLVARDELAGWLGSFSRYKAQKGASDLPNWLEMHRAGTLVVDRKTGDRRTLFVQSAAVSVAGGIQPGVLARAMTAEFLDSGLAARLPMAMPPKLPKKWTDAEIDPEVERAYHDALDQLLMLDFDTKEDEKVAHVLPLSEDGKATWVAFYNDWARQQAGVEGELAAAFSKLEGYAARFALLHHVVERVARGEDDLVAVERASVQAGVTLCHWFAREARRVYALLSETQEQCEARRLYEFIQARGGRISVRQLMRANCRRYPDAEAAEAALTMLVGTGLARWMEAQTTMQGGKEIKAVELCMTHDSDDTDPDDAEEGDDWPHDNGDDSGPDDSPPTPPASPVEAAREAVTPEPQSGVIGVMRHAQHCGNRNGGATERHCHAGTTEAGAPVVMRSPFVGKTTGTPAAYLLVKDAAGLGMVADALDGTAVVGLDVETTGLNQRTDRLRLLSLACNTTDGGTFTYLVDCFAVDPSPLWAVLAGKDLVLHNAAFDLGFLARLGFEPSGRVHDTMLLAQLLTAGTNERVGLAACCQRWLKRGVDKAEQKSDWSGALTDHQLAYAALDAEVLLPLLKTLNAKIKEAGLDQAAEVERRCLPAIIWMAGRGVGLDSEAWRSLAREANEEAASLLEQLQRAAPPKPGELFDAWNFDSTQQARQILALAGCEVPNTTDDTLAGVDHPLAALLRRYRLAKKRGTSFGTAWLSHVAPEDRVYAGWRQIGSAAGRMSCSAPNMQQLPRGAHRKCVAAPPGRVLIKGDYSQIELRIAAKVSGDGALLDAYRRGEDLHTRTARTVLGIAEVTKQHRQLAKALNFGLLFGMGAKGFQAYAKSQYGLAMSEDEARSYRDVFFKSYPGLARWHRRVRSLRADQTRTLTGRRRLLNDKTPDTHRINTPVQGSGADGLKLALALLWERRAEAPGAFPVLAVHDEIVVEADADRAGDVAAWLRRAMLDAMAPLIDPVPVEVEVKVGRTWMGD